MKHITTKEERRKMETFNKKVKTAAITLGVAAFLPISMLPTMAETVGVNTTPEIHSAVNNGFIGVDANNPTINGKTHFQVNAAGNLPSHSTVLLNWGKFNVGSGVTVDWRATNNHQLFLNKVMNSGGMSKIYGTLMSSCGATGCSSYGDTSNVILINPNGVLFGNGSSVNINSFTASTFDINDPNLRIGSNGEYIYNGYVAPTYVGGNSPANPFTANKSAQLEKAFLMSDKETRQIAFVGNNNLVDGKLAKIELDNAQFNTQPGSKAKSVALVGNRIEVKNGSKINTFVQNGTGKGNVTGYDGYIRSNVKLVTSDGVTFKYANTGNVVTSVPENAIVNKSNALANQTYGISTNNSEINSGAIQIVNAITPTTITGTTTNSDVNIIDSIVEGNKMYGTSVPSGEINIASAGNLKVDASRIDTYPRHDHDLTTKNLPYGDITLTAKKHIDIKNSRIEASDSEVNSTGKRVGNITIKAEEGVKFETTDSVDTNVNSKLDGKTNGIAAHGNLLIDGGNGDVIIRMAALDNDHEIIALGFDNVSGNATDRTLTINGNNVDIDNTLLRSGDVNITAMHKDGTVLSQGAITIDNSVLYAYDDLAVKGIETTLTNDLLSYDTLTFDNGINYPYAASNDVEIKDGTTFYDRQVERGEKDTLTISTNGELVFTNNQLKKKGWTTKTDSNVDKAVNQTANINLVSTNNRVTVSDRSNITTNGNITINAKTDANVGSGSSLTSNRGNISMTGGTRVTMGDTNKEGQVIGRSKLTATNGSITLTAQGNVINPDDGGEKDLNGIVIKNSDILSANGNTLTLNSKPASDYEANIKVQGSTIKTTAGSTGNNVIDSKTGDVVIRNSEVNSIGGTSTITAYDLVDVTEGSTISSKGLNKLTSTANKVQVKNSHVTSTNDSIEVNNNNTMNVNKNFAGSTFNANKNIKLTTKGTGSDIGATNDNAFDNFTYGGRLQLDANDYINLTGNDWDLKNVDLNAGTESYVYATNGDIDIIGTLGLGAAGKTTTNPTTLVASGNINANGANYIDVNSNKLIANAGNDINITVNNADNVNKGLEINSNVDTSTNEKGYANLAGKKVTVTVKNEGDELAIAKVKAEDLTITISDTTNIKAANDNPVNPALDNVLALDGHDPAGKAYIEVSGEGLFNLDRDIYNTDSMPGFYNADDHYDKRAGESTNTYHKHFINFDGSQDKNNTNVLLVYQRNVGCVTGHKPSDEEGAINVPSNPGQPETYQYLALDESTFARLPLHEEGVSAVTPIANDVTDPTSQVIMAAARLTVEDEDEDEDFFGSGRF